MENIPTKYKKYKLKPSTETLKELCQPKKFKLQPQQNFLSEFLYDNKKKNKWIINLSWYWIW